MDIESLRKETKGCSTVMHFDNAGASLQPDFVYDSVIDYLECERQIGGYATARQYDEELASFYDTFARLLNCKSNELAFIENATRAWDMAFYSIDFKPGDRILTAKAEYVSNSLAYLQIAKNKGVKIDLVPNDDSGQLDVEALESMVDDDVKLISITHIPTQGGLVNPAEAIGKIARKYNILYLLDACQSVGQMPLDVEKIGCDMLSGTGRKFLRGPRGTGFLYVRESVIDQLEPPFIDLHAAEWSSTYGYHLRSDAKRFENWECFFAGKVGITKAAEYAMSLGLDAIYKQVQKVAGMLRERIQEIPEVTVRDLGSEKCGIVTFTHEKLMAEEVRRRLSELHINISTSTTKSARWDLEERKIHSLSRASVHYYNTEDEVDRFVREIQSLDKN